MKSHRSFEFLRQSLSLRDFGIGTAKLCEEWGEDVLYGSFAAKSLTRAKTIPPATQLRRKARSPATVREMSPRSFEQGPRERRKSNLLRRLPESSLLQSRF